ncbi:SCO6745 family protein [Williamsia sp.]|uniref:SCO6745 family protein n=1 Tax=Williamsia sp. TaxID=1872085 RepID=UPI002F95BA93
MAIDLPTARRLWRLLEPLHAVTYFSDETREALSAAGYRGFWMGYFAARAAPLGPVGPEIVTALFYNFAPAHVAKAIPDAWDFAPPETALQVRQEAAVATLSRMLGDDAADAIDRVVAVLFPVAQNADLGGRALFAANSALPWPTDRVGALWHAATLLREHRGDGHVAALTTAGISGREAGVLHAIANATPRSVLETSRQYSEAEWESLTARLADRGLVELSGAITPAGRALKAEIENTTDRLAAPAYARLSDSAVEDLTTSLMELTKVVVASGEIPSQTPIGLDLDDVG